MYPECVEGCSILDLGAGIGFDCFILSKMVGRSGHVTGVDMTPEQVSYASSLIFLNVHVLTHLEHNLDILLNAV